MTMPADSCGICTRPRTEGVTMRNAGEDTLRISCPVAERMSLLAPALLFALAITGILNCATVCPVQHAKHTRQRKC